MGKFIIKSIKSMRPQKGNDNIVAEKPQKEIERIITDKPQKEVEHVVIENENKNNKVNNAMTTSEKIAMAQSVLTNDEKITPVKRVKKDKGLIERTESSKTILTEDNKELLID